MNLILDHYILKHPTISLAFLLICFNISILSSQTLYEIDTFYPVHHFDDFIEILGDPNNEYTLDQVRNGNLTFRPLKTSELKYQHDYVIAPNLTTSPIYWGRIKVKTNGSLQDWILNFEDRLYYAGAWGRGNGKVDLYAYRNDELLFHKESGTNISNKKKDYPKDWNLHKMSFDIPVDKEIEFFMRIEENQAAVYPFFNMTLRRSDFQYYHPYRNSTTSIQKFIGGAALVLLFYHLALYFFLGDKVYRNYCFWLGVITLNFILLDSNLSYYFTSGLTSTRFTLWMVMSNGMLFFFWYFAQSFVHSRKRFPRMHFLINIFIISLLIWTLISGYMAYNKINVQFGSVVSNMKLIGIFSLFGMMLAIFFAFQKDLFARYFGVSAFLGIGFHFLGALWGLGYIDLKFIPFIIGTAILMIAFPIGLAIRQHEISKENALKMIEAEKAKADAQRIKDLDNIKSKFFSNISHEFRTPISLILGPLQQAENTLNNGSETIPIKRKSFQIVKKNATRLQTLVDQLLDLSKIENAHMKLSLEKGNIIEYIKSCVISFESMAERKNIGFNTSFGQEPEDAYFDKDKLEKIISNLVSNAFKYTPENGTVTVSTSTKNGYVHVDVADTGKGIPHGEISKIFERFYRAEGSEEKGSGIGLALVKELVELHNGQINVSSSVGEGTIFKVRIPYHLHHLPKEVNILEENLPVLNTNPFHTGNEMEKIAMYASAQQLVKENTLPTALLVEDNQDLREFIADILKEDYHIIQAENGLAGEELAITNIPDIIISDVMMPKKDGYALCNSLKQNTKTSHIPVILLTAKAGQQNKMDGLIHGADAYLTKPFDEKELKVRMKNLIDARNAIWEKFKTIDSKIIKDLDLKSADDEFLNDVIRIINENLDNEQFSMEDIGRQVGFSRSQLHRKLKAIINKSPNQLIIEMRLNEAKRMLEARTGTVSEIAFSVGYSSLPYFTKSFKKQFGILPSKIAEEA